MTPLRAHVENGRIIVDDPTDLADGTVLHVVPIGDGEDAEREVDVAWRAEARRRAERIRPGEAETTPWSQARADIFGD